MDSTKYIAKILHTHKNSLNVYTKINDHTNPCDTTKLFCIGATNGVLGERHLRHSKTCHNFDITHSHIE